MKALKTNQQLRSSGILVLASLIWGISFAFQSMGGKALGAYTFNAARLLLGALMLFIITRFSDNWGISKRPITKAEKKL